MSASRSDGPVHHELKTRSSKLASGYTTLGVAAPRNHLIGEGLIQCIRDDSASSSDNQCPNF